MTTRTRRGSAFLLTVGVLASLVAILVSVAATQQVQMRAMTNRIESRRARLMAQSGIQYALVTLENQTANETSQNDDWYTTLGQTGASKFTVAGDSFRVQIIDAGSLVNLNSASEEQLDRLPLTQEQIDSLLDWRTAGETPRQDGAKDDYYNQLTTPYNAKLAPLTTLDELLQVKGFSASALYEPQTDNLTATYQELPTKPDGEAPSLYDLCTVDSNSTMTDANGQALPNITSVNTQQLVQKGVPQNIAAQIVARRNQLTTYRALLTIPGMNTQVARTLVNGYSVGNAQTDTGKINVNTASDAVLQTVPGLTPDIVSSLISRQSTPLTSLGDIFTIPGISLQIAAQSLDALATTSQRFIVRVIGSAGQTNLSLEAVVSISTNGLQVIKVTQLPFADMSERWGWDPSTSSETVLREVTQP